MIDAYKNLLIVKQDMFYFAFKDGQMQKMAFNARDVAPSLHHLFETAPVMYGKLDQLATHLGQVAHLTERVEHALDEGPAKELFTNFCKMLGVLRGECLSTMTAAEMGMHKAYADKKASDIS